MRKLIIDTNLLLLFVIGSLDNQNQIKNSKRLNHFNETDFANLIKIMQEYSEIYITPYIATEVSNLIDLTGWAKEKAFDYLRELFATIFKEIDVNLIENSQSKFFNIYGLTDNSLINLINDYEILTNDDRLCVALYEINPNNVIQYSLLKRIQ